MADEVTAPEFPKPMVKLRRGPGGLEAEIREVADAEAETAATADGFVACPVPPAPFPAYPKWVYHADGQRRVVQNEAEVEKLGAGWEDAPVEGPAEPPPENVGTPAP